MSHTKHKNNSNVNKKTAFVATEMANIKEEHIAALARFELLVKAR